MLVQTWASQIMPANYNWSRVAIKIVQLIKKLVFLIPPQKASPRFSGLPLALGDLVDSRWVLEKIKQSFKLLSKISLHLKPLCRQSSLKLKGYFF